MYKAKNVTKMRGGGKAKKKSVMKKKLKKPWVAP